MRWCSGSKLSRSLIRASVRCAEKGRFSAAIPSAEVARSVVRRQLRQPRSFNAAPEYPRRVRIREKSEFADADLERRARRQRRQRGLQLFQPRLRPLADKLGGDVQVGRGTPLDARGGTQRLDQPLQAVDHLGGQVQAGEQSHAIFILPAFGRK